MRVVDVRKIDLIVVCILSSFLISVFTSIYHGVLDLLFVTLYTIVLGVALYVSIGNFIFDDIVSLMTTIEIPQTSEERQCAEVAEAMVNDIMGNNKDDSVSEQVGGTIQERFTATPGNGLFEKHIVHVKEVPSYEEQLGLINNLTYVTKFDYSNRKVSIQSPKHGSCTIFLYDKPHAKSSTRKGWVCLGNALSQYEKQHDLGNFYECIRLIYAALENGARIVT